MSFLKSIKDALSGSNKPVPHDASGLALAMKKSGARLIPVDDRHLLAEFKTPGLPTPWYAYLTAGDDAFTFRVAFWDTAEELFKRDGWEAKADDYYTVASADTAYAKYGTVGEATERFATMIGEVEANFKEMTTWEGTPKFELMVFDCDRVRQLIAANPWYEKTDEEGDVRLYVPASDKLGIKIGVWLYIKERRITVDTFTTGVTLVGRLEGVAKELAEELDGVKITVEDGRARIKAYVDPEDYNAEKVALEPTMLIENKIKELLDVWCTYLRKLGMRVAKNDYFDADAIRAKMKKESEFIKVDSDGDIRLGFKEREDAHIERFMWILPKSDRVRLTGGIENFAKLSKISDLKKIINAYNARKTGLNAFENNGSVQLEFVIDVDGYPATKPTAKALPDIVAAKNKLFAELLNLARDAKMEVFYYKPTEETIMQILEGMPTFNRVENMRGQSAFVKAPDGTELYRYKVNIELQSSGIMLIAFFDSPIPLPSSSKKAIGSNLLSMLPKTDTTNGYGDKGGVGVYRKYEYTDFADDMAIRAEINKYTKAFGSQEQAMVKACVEVLKEQIKREIEEHRQAEERRQREERERAERERQRREQEEREERSAAAQARQEGLDSWNSWDVESDDTIRRIQEWFTGCYPYLNISMIKKDTATRADRSGGTIEVYDEDLTVGQIRSYRGDATVKIYGSDTPADVIKRFRSETGLIVKLGHNGKHDERYYIANDDKFYKMAIYDINEYLRDNGYYKADIS